MSLVWFSALLGVSLVGFSALLCVSLVVFSAGLGVSLVGFSALLGVCLVGFSALLGVSLVGFSALLGVSLVVFSAGLGDGVAAVEPPPPTGTCRGGRMEVTDDGSVSRWPPLSVSSTQLPVSDRDCTGSAADTSRSVSFGWCSVTRSDVTDSAFGEHSLFLVENNSSVTRMQLVSAMASLGTSVVCADAVNG